MKRKEKDTCCATCPFLKQNFGKPTPNPEQSPTDWYSKENMLNLWKELKRAEPMICHSSDPENKTYGGTADIKKGVQKYCTGALMIQFRHVKAYENLFKSMPGGTTPKAIHKEYKKLAGKDAMALEDIYEFMLAVTMGRTDLLGGLSIPRSCTEEREVALQWDSPVSNSDPKE